MTGGNLRLSCKISNSLTAVDIMAERTEEQMVALVQDGDVELFRELVERYEPKLTRYARRFLFDSDEAKDLLQEVFIKAYVNIKSFDIERRFSPWLYRVAH